MELGAGIVCIFCIYVEHIGGVVKGRMRGLVDEDAVCWGKVVDAGGVLVQCPSMTT